MPRDTDKDRDDEGKESSEKEGNENKQDMTKKVYGDYEILKAIGKGKFAVVYRAKRKSDGEIVALKRISVDTVDDKTREKCLKEVKLLQSLDHPNIIRYMDSFINENDLVIVFEWAAAGDLKRQLRKAQEKETPFEERIIWKYFSQIADAIQHMHERRIMHRDLKPANIFLTLDGTVKLGDLGLSRELSDNTLQAHSKVGTPLYMSPEVLRGDGYDFKSDIWSIGCLLYELAMLKSPFKSEGLNLYSLFQKISKGEYSPLPDRYSEELRTLACSMISTNSEDRPEIGYICEVAAHMRTKYTDEYVKQRRLSKQREKEASTTTLLRLDTEDKSEGGEDRSVASNASSKTAGRQKTNPNHRHRGVKDPYDRNDNDQDDEYKYRDSDRDRDRGSDRGSDDTHDREHDRDNGGHARRGSGAGSSFMNSANKKDDPNENSLPSFQNPSSHHESDKNNSNKYNDLMVNLKGDEYHSHSDKKTSASGAISGNRFSDQALGQSAGSRDSNDWGGSRGKKKDKHKMDNSHGSSGDNISLPRNNLNGRVGDGGKVFAHDDHNDHTSINHPNNHDNDRSQSYGNSNYSTNHHNQQNRGHQTNYNRQQENPYVIPVADQRDNSSKKPEMKVQRRKKDVSELGGDGQSRRGSATKQNSRHQTPPKNSGRGQYDDEDLTAASPMQMQAPSTNSYLMSGIAMAQMEVLYGKLILLKFPIYLDAKSSNKSDGHAVGPMKCRLCPLHFAGDLSSIMGRRAHEFPATQFHTFVQVAEWLAQKAKGSMNDNSDETFSSSFTIDVYNDSPGSIAKQLLIMAQNAGVPQQAMSEITPTNLSAGHGDNACIFLNLIADVSIQKHYKKQGLIYPSDIVEDGGVGLDLNDDDVEDGVVEDDDILLESHVAVGHEDDEGQSQLHMSMIVGGIDSAQWKEETERVASKLSAGQSNNLKKNFTSWSSHVQTFQKHTKAILSCTLEHGEDDESIEDSIPVLLHGVQRAVLEGVSGIARAESMLNNKQEFSDASIQYAKIKQELDHLEVLSGLSGKNSIIISDKLAEVQEQVEEVAAKLAEKTGETDADGGGSVMNLKRAIKRIKDESLEMQLTTAMLQQQIMNFRIEQATTNRKKKIGQKKKGGPSYSRRKRNQGNDDDDKD